MSDVTKQELAEIIASLLANNDPAGIINTPWFKDVLNQYKEKQTKAEKEKLR